MQYDALLLVSFGGPEQPEDVLPFLENVTRGRNIPRERLLEVAEHYYHFGGKSPINDQNRALIGALREHISLPIYWGNRNWHPMLPHAVRQMQADGVRRALAFVTSAYSSYSSCRQYRENIAAARALVGEGAPDIDKLPVFYNHSGFVQACAARVAEALKELPHARLVVTAHSIPSSMASTCAYEAQLRETARLVAGRLGLSDWDLVFQSRSGPPTQPWLGPDILDHMRDLHARGIDRIVIAPLGFISDHMEVLYDLDTEARVLADEIGMQMVRAETVGTHPAFIRCICELIDEQIAATAPIRVCAPDCCPAPPASGRPHVSPIQTVSQPT